MKAGHVTSKASFTEDLREKFLARLSESGHIGIACRESGVSRLLVLWHRDNDREFRALLEEAQRLGLESLEDEAVRRARDGVDEPVFYRGEQCGSIKRYSDLLLMFLLKAVNPARYRDNYRVELHGDLESVRLSDEERAAKIAELLAIAAARKEAEDQGEGLH